jgi:hypothetical protein
MEFQIRKIGGLTGNLGSRSLPPTRDIRFFWIAVKQLFSV